MKFLNLDDEQAAMLIDAADLSARFLRHRSARIDPEGILSKAAELQAHKLDNIRAQLAQPEIAAWGDIDPAAQAAIRGAAAQLAASTDPQHVNVLWRQLLGAVVSARHKSPIPFEAPHE